MNKKASKNDNKIEIPAVRTTSPQITEALNAILERVK